MDPFQKYKEHEKEQRRERRIKNFERERETKYLKKVEEELVKESHRVSECMDASTEAPLLKVVESVLLAKRLSSSLENEGSGVKIMLRDDKRDDL